MKQIFFICCIAISALAVSAFTNVNKHQINLSNYSLNDTVPSPMTDTMHNMNGDTMNHNMMSDTSMMKKDSSTAFLHQ